MSSSSLSENVSINNGSNTPQGPLTPPPSPLTLNEKTIVRADSSENEKPINESPDSTDVETDTQMDEQSSQNIVRFFFLKRFLIVLFFK